MLFKKVEVDFDSRTSSDFAFTDEFIKDEVEIGIEKFGLTLVS